jgi:hypothetical protein
MNILCTLKQGGMRRVPVQFDPPLKKYEDAMPRLLEMKAIAQEGLGIVRVFVRVVRSLHCLMLCVD